MVSMKISSQANIKKATKPFAAFSWEIPVYLELLSSAKAFFSASASTIGPRNEVFGWSFAGRTMLDDDQLAAFGDGLRQAPLCATRQRDCPAWRVPVSLALNLR